MVGQLIGQQQVLSHIAEPDPRFRPIKWLQDFGHFERDGAGFRNARAVNPDQVERNVLTLEDEATREAIRSIQNFDANFADIFRFYYGLEWDDQNRKETPDDLGQFGPATQRLFTTPRCSCPDFGDRARGIIATGEEIGFGTSGSGSWPAPGCDPESPYPERHSVRFYVDTSNTPAPIKAYLAKVLQGAQECLGEAGLRVRYVKSASEAELTIKWQFLRGGVIGWYAIYSGGGCSQTLSGRMDTSYDAGWYMVCLLLIHEALGHGIGHQHTSGGIMNSSIRKTRATAEGWPTYKDDGSRNNVAWKRMVNWFGGERIFYPDDPRIVEPPPPDDPTDPPVSPLPKVLDINGHKYTREGETLPPPIVF